MPEARVVAYPHFTKHLEKIKENNNWQIGIVYSSVENAYQGNMVYYTASPGHNIFNFSAPGYIWRIRFLHSNTAQDIEFNLDNFYLEDLTVDSFLKAEADIISATDYSPFGAPLPSRTYQASEYRFAFNGKEKIDEINGAGNDLDFGARIYDARLGRWLSLDPLKEKYPSFSPFCFASNKPILFVDHDGRDIIISTQFNQSVYKSSFVKLLNAKTTFTESFIIPFTAHGKDIRLDYFSLSTDGLTQTSPCDNLGNNQPNYTDGRMAVTSDNTRKLTGKEAVFFNSDAIFQNEFDPISGAPIYTSGKQGGTAKGYFVSENYMLVAIMHEFMHTNLLTHEEMAMPQNITLVANTLMKLDSKLDLNQASALAWAGLQDTKAWKSKSIEEQKGILLEIETQKRGKADSTVIEDTNSLNMVPDQTNEEIISSDK